MPMPTPICEVMVGLPGTGKSTLVQRIQTNPSTFIYSTDNILERIAAQLDKTYDEVFDNHFDSAQTEANIFLAEAIKNKQDIIWDQINIGLGKRKKILNRMRQAGYQVRCKCIIPPNNDYSGDKEDWVYRLNNRPGKTIPQNILTNMIEWYILPTIDEGFDELAVYDMHGALLSHY